MDSKRKTPASRIALGGVLAALAVVIMSLGGLFPIFTYVSPMLCALVLQMVLMSCGGKIAWAWYGAVAILAVLLSPDKEAAAVFTFLGYYPIIKPKFDRLNLAWLWKIVYFNICIGVMYFLLLHLFGMAELAADFQEAGTVLLIVMLIMGNVTFVLLDKLLQPGRLLRRRR